MINLTLKFIINEYDIYIIGILRENNACLIHINCLNQN